MVEVVAGRVPTMAPATEPLRRFLQVARGAGLRVSAAEGIDAARAVDLVGFEDRALLKDSLGLVLAKTPDEKAAYDEVFDIYFKRDEFAGGNDDIPSNFVGGPKHVPVRYRLRPALSS